MTFDHWATVIAAHDQAAAAVEAARISAEATNAAALIQGGATLAAGLLALGAGILAYLAATRQVWLAERQYEDMVEAFRVNLQSAAGHLSYLMNIAIVLAKEDDRRHASGLPRLNHHLVEYTLPQQFTEDAWMHQAMLGKRVVSQLHFCRSLILQLNRRKLDFDAEMRRTTVYDYQNIDVYTNEDGATILEPSLEGIPFAEIAEYTKTALNNLLTMLVVNPQKRSGRRSILTWLIWPKKRAQADMWVRDATDH